MSGCLRAANMASCPAVGCQKEMFAPARIINQYTDNRNCGVDSESSGYRAPACFANFNSADRCVC